MTTTTPSSPENPRPKVSVCVVTYNQEKYIAQCLQSLVDQETDFPFEIIVGDDCSTDSTRAIVSDFATQYPNIIRPVLREKNIGAAKNYLDVHALARGDYVAHMDGDDYALPGKIQAQADFLDENSDCQIVWHKMNILNIITNDIYGQEYDCEYLGARKFYVNDVVRSITLGLHSSKMYRKWACNIGYSLDALDFSENVLHLSATGGYAGFLACHAYGVYRVNNGVSRGRGAIRIKIYEWLMYFYSMGVVERRVLAAKVFLMVLSDIKHKSTSFYCGLGILFRMARSISLYEIAKCHRNVLPISLANLSE